MGRGGTHPYQVTKRNGRDDFHVVRNLSLFYPNQISFEVLGEPRIGRRGSRPYLGQEESDDVEVVPTSDYCRAGIVPLM